MDFFNLEIGNEIAASPEKLYDQAGDLSKKGYGIMRTRGNEPKRAVKKVVKAAGKRGAAEAKWDQR